MAKTNNNPHGIKVGQELYVPPTMWSNPSIVTVTKVGRLWGTTGRNSRFDLETMRYEHGRGRLYLSLDHYKQCFDEHVAAKALIEVIYGTKLPGVAKCRAAAEALGLGVVFEAEVDRVQRFEAEYARVSGDVRRG